MEKNIKNKKTDSKKIIENTQTKLKKITQQLNDNIKEKDETIKKVTQQKENKNKTSVEKQPNIKKNKKATYVNLQTGELLLVILVVVFISILIGYKLGRKDTKQVVLDENLNQFVEVYNNVKLNYYKEVNSNELIQNAIDGMLEGLDDYSLYFDEDSATTFNSRLDGEYEGLGVEIIQIEDKIIVYQTFEDSPAEKAGIKSGDIIIKIDDVEVSGKTSSEVANYIRENKKSTFKIEVERKDKIFEYTLTREKVIINSVSYKSFKINEKNIGYIYIGMFSNTSFDQFKNALATLEKEKIDSLIVDVRDNTGGHLTTAVNILSLFLDSKKVIYQIENQGKITKYYSVGNVDKKYNIVILQNTNSASASELVSITLKEQLGATIIGETSYGKGTVQELIELSDGTEYKFTTKKWLSPKGVWINEKGIEPDISISLDEKYYNNPTDETDNQLQKALEILTK